MLHPSSNYTCRNSQRPQKKSRNISCVCLEYSSATFIEPGFGCPCRSNCLHGTHGCYPIFASSHAVGGMVYITFKNTSAHNFLILGGWPGLTGVRFGTWTLLGGTMDMRSVIAFSVLAFKLGMGVGRCGREWQLSRWNNGHKVCHCLSLLWRWDHESKFKYHKWQRSFISIRPATTYVNT